MTQRTASPSGNAPGGSLETVEAEDKPVADTDLANAIRVLAMDAVEAANSGHPGMPMGMADVATVLFRDHLRFDPRDPAWPDRDRFVLSAGHGSMLLYALLYLTGYPDIGIDEIRRFRQLGSRTPGHPEIGCAAGVETTTGPLGQGLGNAVGMALAERLLAARYGRELVDHWTYVIAGDGCLMEGISHEAASLAGHLQLGRLIVLWDDNRITIDGDADLSVSDDQLSRFSALGWDVRAVDGHDQAQVSAALDAARADDRPSLVACRTEIGRGAPNKGGTADSHGAPLGSAEVQAVREALGWPYPPFAVPEHILAAWRRIGTKGEAARQAWQDRLAASPPVRRESFLEDLQHNVPASADRALAEIAAEFRQSMPKLATRQSTNKVLAALVPNMPSLLGGSADLSGSNGTKVAAHRPVSAGDFSGNYMHYGVREHGMAAAMNGMTLHGGVRPYGGSFLVFTDYCRPAIRLAALMHQPAIYVMSHDSIGLGEDGPTHQPVEQLAALRAIPGLVVMRPADALETVECWHTALHRKDGPCVLVTTRQGVPAQARPEGLQENAAARGAYILAEAQGGPPRAVLLGSGSEVSIAMAARDLLQAGGMPTRVVSVPSHELFLAQDRSYRDTVLAAGERGVVRAAVEAAIRLGWDRLIGDGPFVGMTGFGASAPYEELYAHFGITAEALAEGVRQRLSEDG
ncbi:MAG: transketolase [Roseitalea porphyridii]|uniref:transketolase n=1 Tax=Roseitalea porphyridii TaxID=1852022 RepID=UPI0032EDA870